MGRKTNCPRGSISGALLVRRHRFACRRIGCRVKRVLEPETSGQTAAERQRRQIIMRRCYIRIGRYKKVLYWCRRVPPGRISQLPFFQPIDLASAIYLRRRGQQRVLAKKNGINSYEKFALVPGDLFTSDPTGSNCSRLHWIDAGLK